MPLQATIGLLARSCQAYLCRKLIAITLAIVSSTAAWTAEAASVNCLASLVVNMTASPGYALHDIPVVGSHVWRCLMMKCVRCLRRTICISDGSGCKCGHLLSMQLRVIDHDDISPSHTGLIRCSAAHGQASRTKGAKRRIELWVLLIRLMQKIVTGHIGHNVPGTKVCCARACWRRA